MSPGYACADNQDGFAGRSDEVSVIIGLGGAVWFFLFISNLLIPDAWQLSPETV